MWWAYEKHMGHTKWPSSMKTRTKKPSSPLHIFDYGDESERPP
jgi:hypothetical protein